MAQRQYKCPETREWISEEEFMAKQEANNDSEADKDLSEKSKSDLWQMVKDQDLEGLEWTSTKDEMVEALKEIGE